MYEIPARWSRNRQHEPEFVTSSPANLPIETSVLAGLFGKPVRDTHHERLYDFSVAPWRISECLWPNVSGHLFPVNRRWLSALQAEDRVWTPTLYLGLMPLAMALMTWRLRTNDCYRSWLSLVALGALVGSFGWYGLGWLAGEVAARVGPVPLRQRSWASPWAVSTG